MHDIHDPDHRSRLTDHDRPTARLRARPRARKYLVTPLERGIMTQERIHPIHDHPPGRSGRSGRSVGRRRRLARSCARAGRPRAARAQVRDAGARPRTANSLRERDERDAFVSARERARDSRASRLPAIDRSIIRGRAFRDTRRGSLVRSSSGGELNGASRDEGDSARWRAWKK